jgi:hypothetical protein
MCAVRFVVSNACLGFSQPCLDVMTYRYALRVADKSGNSVIYPTAVVGKKQGARTARVVVSWLGARHRVRIADGDDHEGAIVAAVRDGVCDAWKYISCDYSQ